MSAPGRPWSASAPLAALIVQALLATQTGLPVARVLLLSLVASLVGLLGAKLDYVAGHLEKGDLATGLSHLTGGMCIQGFVLAPSGPSWSARLSRALLWARS